MVILLAAVCIMLSNGCKTSGFAARSAKHASQQKYFPDEFKNLWFGMSISDFRKATKVKLTPEPALMSFRIEYVQNEFDNPELKEVTYYFDDDGENPLYEMIIEYHSASQRDRVAASVLGPPNEGEEWKFDSGEGFDLRAWQFRNKLVIIGVLPGTEWEEEYQ